VPLNIGNK